MLTVSQHAAQIRSHADTASNEAIVVEMGTKDRKWKLSLRVSGDSHRRGPAYPAPARLPMLEALLTGATRSIPSIWHEYGMQRDEPPTHPPTISSAPRGGARRNAGLHLEVERREGRARRSLPAVEGQRRARSQEGGGIRPLRRRVGCGSAARSAAVHAADSQRPCSIPCAELH